MLKNLDKISLHSMVSVTFVTLMLTTLTLMTFLGASLAQNPSTLDDITTCTERDDCTTRNECTQDCHHARPYEPIPKECTAPLEHDIQPTLSACERHYLPSAHASDRWRRRSNKSDAITSHGASHGLRHRFAEETPLSATLRLHALRLIPTDYRPNLTETRPKSPNQTKTRPNPTETRLTELTPNDTHAPLSAGDNGLDPDLTSVPHTAEQLEQGVARVVHRLPRRYRPGPRQVRPRHPSRYERLRPVLRVADGHGSSSAMFPRGGAWKR